MTTPTTLQTSEGIPDDLRNLTAHLRYHAFEVVVEHRPPPRLQLCLHAWNARARLSPTTANRLETVGGGHRAIVRVELHRAADRVQVDAAVEDRHADGEVVRSSAQQEPRAGLRGGPG